MEQQLTSVGQYSALENTVFFEDGTIHNFRGELLTRLTVEECYKQLQHWANFKGFITLNEEIIVPGFVRESVEEKQ